MLGKFFKCETDKNIKFYREKDDEITIEHFVRKLVMFFIILCLMEQIYIY